MQFIHQALAWGFLIALAPVLIHLINMMRRRRVKWAAMEFLLQSYRKHRRWVWLKQLLLLLMRMAAVALIVAMLAGWVSREKWLAIFGERTTQHYVLLDDSYSMSERAGGASAFERGLQAVSRIAARLSSVVCSPTMPARRSSTTMASSSASWSSVMGRGQRASLICRLSGCGQR